VYTFKTTLTGAAFEVHIGAAATNTFDNLKCAINASGCVAGTDYGTGTTKHPIVTAGTKTATTLVVTSDLPGTLYNSIGTTKSSSVLSWTGSTLASGTASGCISEIANGVYWWVGNTAFLYRGNSRVDFVYSGVSAHWEDFAVVAQASYDVNVAGNVVTV